MRNIVLGELTIKKKIRSGKTKQILDSSIDAALLAVETYNKPRAKFRMENYVMLMIIAWTRLFHAYFNVVIGDKYYYKNDSGTRYKKQQGEKQAWDLSKCIKELRQLPNHLLLSEAAESNITLFVKLRNKIAHRYVSKKELENFLFGQLQSLLYNYEDFIYNNFGEKYAIEHTLSYSLQFSMVRCKEQVKANKRALSSEIKDIKNFVDKYQSQLTNNILDSTEYSTKLLLMPTISNTQANDLAVEFHKPGKNESEELLSVITKYKEKTPKIANKNRFIPSQVVYKVSERRGSNDFKIHHHTLLWKLFKVRPSENKKYSCNVKYCLYDEAHKNFVYLEDWINLIVRILKKHSVDDIKNHSDKNNIINVKRFLNRK